VVAAPEPPLLVEDRAEHFIQGLSYDGKVLITYIGPLVRQAVPTEGIFLS
jgi:hypothetical protein